MNATPHVTTAALLLGAALAAATPASAALPIGLDVSAGGGARKGAEGSPSFDIRVGADLRLGVLTLGGEFRDQPPWLRSDDPLNYSMGYFNLGVNIPLPKGRIALRAGIGGGKAGGVEDMFGFHESAGLHIFPKGPLGFGFAIDFDQTFRGEQFEPRHGVAGNGLLLLRI